MAFRVNRTVASVFVLGGLIGAAQACGSSEADSVFPETNANGDDTTNNDLDGGNTVKEGGGFELPDGNVTLPDSTTQAACTNLCLQQVKCDGGGTTSLSGRVYDPAGKVPLYNVVVYVPNSVGAALDPITTGATCDRCGVVSGKPLVTTITDASGAFKLDNVPVGQDIPLVMQVGKWRRKITIPAVTACTNQVISTIDTDGRPVTRLPRDKFEGDIPQIAISTGGLDAFECFLRKVGIADSEFTTEGFTGNANGRIHLYAGSGNGPQNRPYPMQAGDYSPATRQFADQAKSANANGMFTRSDVLWSDLEKLKKYDITLLACEGDTFPETKPAAALKAMYDYTALGGRLFTSHWHRFWFNTTAGEHSPAAPDGGTSFFPAFATWGNHTPVNGQQPRPDCFSSPGTCNDPLPATILTTLTGGDGGAPFPKALAMSEWMVNVGGGTYSDGGLPTTFPLVQPRHTVDAVDGTKAQPWITIKNPTTNTTAYEYLSFNTPIGKPENELCGRVVHSDLHVSSGNGDIIGQGDSNPWPNLCKSANLSPQEKALEFMLFDLSSCIQKDDAPPTPPPVDPQN